jgi:hypothetical protein
MSRDGCEKNVPSGYGSQVAVEKLVARDGIFETWDVAVKFSID